MPTQIYVADRELCIEHKEFKKGEVIVAVTTPDGIPIDKAVNAIVRHFVVPAPAAPAAAPAPEVPLPAAPEAPAPTPAETEAPAA